MRIQHTRKPPLARPPSARAVQRTAKGGCPTSAAQTPRRPSRTSTQGRRPLGAGLPLHVPVHEAPPPLRREALKHPVLAPLTDEASGQPHGSACSLRLRFTARVPTWSTCFGSTSHRIVSCSCSLPGPVGGLRSAYRPGLPRAPAPLPWSRKQSNLTPRLSSEGPQLRLPGALWASGRSLGSPRASGTPLQWSWRAWG